MGKKRPSRAHARRFGNLTSRTSGSCKRCLPCYIWDYQRLVILAKDGQNKIFVLAEAIAFLSS